MLTQEPACLEGKDAGSGGEREREWCWWEIKAHPGKSAYRVHRVQTQQLNTLHLKTQTITKQNLLSLNLGLGEPN